MRRDKELGKLINMKEMVAYLRFFVHPSEFWSRIFIQNFSNWLFKEINWLT
jgi:hypothetical protein